MGAAASKQAASKATSAAAKATATAASTQSNAAAIAAFTQQPVRVTKTTLSAEQIAGVAAAAKTKRDAAADLIRNPQAAPKVELMEMKDDLLKEMEQFQDFEKVAFLEQDMEGFRKTASSYRPRSTDPISMPTDRTSNASSGTGVVEKMDGRLSNQDVRFLLRLHYEDPETWTNDALASHFGLDPKILANVLAHVGPPNVLKPLGPGEHPIGIWFESPAAAAAMIPEFPEPGQQALPSSSSGPQ